MSGGCSCRFGLSRDDHLSDQSRIARRSGLPITFAMGYTGAIGCPCASLCEPCVFGAVTIRIEMLASNTNHTILHYYIITFI